MQPRVTAILIVRNGEPWLDRTLRALRAQTRQPDDLVLVDCASTDGSAELLTAAAPNGSGQATATRQRSQVTVMAPSSPGVV